jgi:hypothetical protein
MEKIKYRDLIMQYLTALEPDQTITTEQVAQYVAERLLLDAAMVKKTVNVNMARLEKEGQIMRLTKGIYCRRVKTAFGYYTPDKETLFCKQLLRKENEIIGYETGLSALNRIGLVSQMPRRRCIATNLHTKRVPEGMQIEIRKPPIVVNSDNFRYLQILDAIRELDMAPVDTAKPIDVVRATVEEFTLKTEMLILIVLTKCLIIRKPSEQLKIRKLLFRQITACSSGLFQSFIPQHLKECLLILNHFLNLL